MRVGPRAPTGYTDPVAAVRMLAGQCVDFNGGPALNSAAGNYLKYDSATSKLFYYVGGVAKWSVDASGQYAMRRHRHRERDAMTPELARAALEFLKRTELRGVECFVMHALLQELERDASQQAEWCRL